MTYTSSTCQFTKIQEPQLFSILLTVIISPIWNFFKILIQIEYMNPFFDISLYVTLNKTIPNEYTGALFDNFY